MPGLLVFRSLRDAVRAGFAVYDKFADGYLVRQRIGDRWQLAIVSFRDRPELPERPDSAQLANGIRHLQE
jgi:hypothetical protein